MISQWNLVRVPCVVSLVWMMFSGAPVRGADRPNVVMIAIDDLNDWIGCLGGHPQAQTPHMDRLAARGMLFANAHCQAPLCNPSRTSILTGLRPSTTGIYALEPWFRTVDSLRDHVTLPQYFKRAGYRTLTAGKIYHGGYPPKPQRSEEFDVWGPPSAVGVRPPEKLVHTPEGDHPLVDWGTFPHKDEDKGDWHVASWAVEQLNAHPQEPFFLAAGFFLPHVPCYATQQWFDLYPTSSLKMPVVPTFDRADTPARSWYLHWKLPEPRLSWLREQNQWEPLVRAYLACVSFVDSQVGRVLDAVDANGLEKNTIVVLWSDHGWHLGEKGISGKNSLWKESTRVPLMFAGPGIAQGVCNSQVELLDLYPTLADLCQLPPPPRVEGHSLLAQLRNPHAERSWPAIVTQSPNNHAVVMDGWRYIRYADGSEELYDENLDQGDWTNLANDSAFAEQKQKLAKWLPEKSADPAPGSRSRLLIRDGDEWIWEGEPIKPEDLVE